MSNLGPVQGGSGSLPFRDTGQATGESVPIYGEATGKWGSSSVIQVDGQGTLKRSATSETFGDNEHSPSKGMRIDQRIPGFINQSINKKQGQALLNQYLKILEGNNNETKVDNLFTLLMHVEEFPVISKEKNGLLHLIAKYNRVNHLNTLIDIMNSQDSSMIKIPVNYCNKHGLTALHVAANQDSQGVAKGLLTLGIGIDLLDKNGDTALHLASRNGFIDMVELLLHYNANRSLTNEDGETAHAAAQTGGHSEIVALLNRTNEVTTSSIVTTEGAEGDKSVQEPAKATEEMPALTRQGGDEPVDSTVSKPMDEKGSIVASGQEAEKNLPDVQDSASDSEGEDEVDPDKKPFVAYESGQTADEKRCIAESPDASAGSEGRASLGSDPVVNKGEPPENEDSDNVDSEEASSQKSCRSSRTELLDEEEASSKPPTPGKDMSFEEEDYSKPPTPGKDMSFSDASGEVVEGSGSDAEPEPEPEPPVLEKWDQD